MFGPPLVVRSLSAAVLPDQYGNRWQYHSRSDRHSKIACWAILFDLLLACPLLVEQIQSGTVAFGINHEMRDFRLNRQKNLDLVLCTPREDGDVRGAALDFAELAKKYGIDLTRDEQAALATLPNLPARPVGAVRLALEAKACMTSHLKARPRLYDELNSSHLTIHGASDVAIAAGFVMINFAPTFRSTDMNKFDMKAAYPKVSKHRQPDDTLRVMEKVREIPRRSKLGEDGFDAVAIVVVECTNDGSPITLVEGPPAPPAGDIFHYESMIRRVAHLYESRFGRG